MSRKKRENGGMQTNDATETTPKPTRTRTPRDPNAPPVKRPRSGTWTKISKQVGIPGTGRGAAELAKTMGPFGPGGVMPCGEDPDTIDLEMYRVEFAGETLEVRRDRAGVKKANEWIRAIKGADERNGRMLKIHAALLVLEGEETRDDMKRRLGLAAAALLDREPTA